MMDLEQFQQFTEGYSVSNYGRIRNDKTEHFYKPQKRNKKNSDHFSVHIKGKNYSVSRLVATHFVSNPDSLPIVRHWDGNAENNYYKNLVWGTQKDNTDDSFRHGTHTSLNSTGFQAQQNEAGKPSKVRRKRKVDLPMGVFPVKGKTRTKYHARFSTNEYILSLGTFHSVYEAFEAVKKKYFEVYEVYPPEPENALEKPLISSEELDKIEINGKKKLTEQEAREILYSPLNAKELAVIYGIARQTVNTIKARRTWKHL